MIARRPEVLWRSTSGGPVVLGPGWDLPRHLQGAAALIWEVLDRPLRRTAVAAEVTELAGGAVDADVLAAAIAELVELGVAEERSS